MDAKYLSNFDGEQDIGMALEKSPWVDYWLQGKN